ncbi:hypothetical protein [Vannielia litorea]|uniref:Uncharacterized protein n=1 Tax=Vannielia litorea TaxID=1217970 RepID=A0A1N6E3H9_9RHOB|nr:hypothetical protein [Vannielia litorea]SIN77552.1 hypothetical protein SAMN05444002_0293 [Vannielia litorea]
MYHSFSLASALAVLGLVSAIYLCNLRTRPGSWLRSDLLGMVLMALLTSLLPLALGAAGAALWQSLTGGVTAGAFLTAGTDLLAVALIVAAGLVFRALVRATYRATATPDNVTPLTPRPAAPRPSARGMTRAA